MMICCAPVQAQQEQPTPTAQADDQVDDQLDEQLAEVLDASDSWSASDLRFRDYTLYWDNDGTLPRVGQDTDRFYTNGAGIELSFDPGLSDALKEKLAPAGEWTDPRFGVGVAIKQYIFTSSDITIPNPAPTDHPYAGYLYLAFSFQRADAKKHDHFELDIGVVGERSQGEMTQKFIHNLFPNQDDPQGWGTQLGNEPTLNFTFERTWKTERGDIKGFEFEMLPAIGFDLGNVSTKARGRVTLRIGKHLPNDFGPATLLGHKDHTINADDFGEGRWSFYAYATLGMDMVAREIFTDGNTFISSRSVNTEPLVAIASIGFVTRFKSIYFGWSQSYQTETFETQPSGQAWGSIVFGYSFKM